MTFRKSWQVVVCTMIILGTACRRSGEAKLATPGNRLIRASSPYLKEHADNPVDWYEWGPEALAKAREEGKPLLVSIGYASCHWCHVMERESFMDTAVAKIMNENFISIKVDREERPDVDQIYINAAQLISGNAGWPLNAFALPDGKPFYAATYFPKDQWIKVLQQVSKAYKENNENVVKQAEAITKGIQTLDAIAPTVVESKFTKEEYQDIFGQWQSQLDFELGGLAGSPKFPMPVVWEYLLQDHYLTGSRKSLEIVTTTLDNMADGGIYDHLEGGFARYSTDGNWKVPHFEKMLYDNGQLVSLYSHAFQVTKNSKYGDVIQQTLQFVNNELLSPEGGFYSSINADSEGEEGKFYTWTKKEIVSLLDERSAKLFVNYYNITDSGNWEHQKNILYKTISDEEFAKQHSVSSEELKNALSSAKQLLLKARSKRVRPSVDDKIMTSWNALMLNGYLDAYTAINRKEYLEVALKNATFLEKKMIREDGRLWRSYKDNVPSVEAFLDDYALLSKAYIHLYEVTFDFHWLGQAKAIANYTLQHFKDQQREMFYYTSNDAEALIARKMELTDNVIPASNSVMADVLFRLGTYYEDDSLLMLSHTMLNQIKADMIKNGPYYANWATLMGKIAYQPYEVAIMGDDAVEKSRQMQKLYLPTTLFMGGRDENLPLLENKNLKGETIIYVCRNKVCKQPVKTVEEAILQMK